jgi:hypothetical protein
MYSTARLSQTARRRRMVNIKKFLLEENPSKISISKIRYSGVQETCITARFFQTERRRKDGKTKMFLLQRQSRENYQLLYMSKIWHRGVQKLIQRRILEKNGK